MKDDQLAFIRELLADYRKVAQEQESTGKVPEAIVGRRLLAAYDAFEKLLEQAQQNPAVESVWDASYLHPVLEALGLEPIDSERSLS